jgi:hypothetical protein
MRPVWQTRCRVRLAGIHYTTGWSLATVRLFVGFDRRGLPEWRYSFTRSMLAPPASKAAPIDMVKRAPAVYPISLMFQTNGD